MRLNLDALYVLDAIARKGSFAAAADELHRVPSALTYTIKKLEQDLDVELFDRSGHRAQLTAAGAELLAEGRHVLRAAQELESRIKRIATGWEGQLRIAVDDIVPWAGIYDLVEAFYAGASGTRLRLMSEVYGGSWDALFAERADLVIGAPGDAPAGGGYSTFELGRVEFVFVVAPSHPLASAAEPISNETVLQHRAVSVADSSRQLPPRTSGLLSGQDVLTVPNLAAKRAAQCRGLGAGYLPRFIAAADIAAGRLVEKAVVEGKPAIQLFVAWRTNCQGQALEWFLARLRQPDCIAGLLKT